MITYTYQCTACKVEFDVQQNITDSVLTDCTQCKQATLKKIISPAPFTLKGKGWYATDYKKS